MCLKPMYTEIVEEMKKKKSKYDLPMKHQKNVDQKRYGKLHKLKENISGVFSELNTRLLL